jgi:hypothetical protein
MLPQNIDSLGSLARSVRREVVIRGSALRMESRLALAARRSTPVVVGPWLSEIGFELLYWIPMLNRIASRYGIEPEQMVAVSRGGAEAWYSHICGRYVDAFDFVSEQELRGWHERRTAADGLKQLSVTPLEREILARARATLGGERAAVLHPLVMYSRFRYFWVGEQPISAVRERCEYRPLSAGAAAATDARALDGLPEDYVAVKPYFSLCFPDTEENRGFVRRLLDTLLRRTSVVLLTTGLAIDDHGEFETAARGSLYDARRLMTARDNLAVQTRLIGRAKALFTTYGGFSYLGPFLGVPSLSFYSDENFNPAHLDVMRRALPDLRGPGFAALHRREFPLSDTALLDLAPSLSGS